MRAKAQWMTGKGALDAREGAMDDWKGALDAREGAMDDWKGALDARPTITLMTTLICAIVKGTAYGESN